MCIVNTHQNRLGDASNGTCTTQHTHLYSITFGEKKTTTKKNILSKWVSLRNCIPSKKKKKKKKISFRLE